MQLTRLQRQVLSLYLTYRDRAPTMGTLMRRAVKYQAPLITIALVTSVFTSSIGMLSISFLLAGMLVGALLRELGTFHRFLQLWPAMVQGLDWECVREILGSEEERKLT